MIWINILSLQATALGHRSQSHIVAVDFKTTENSWQVDKIQIKIHAGIKLLNETVFL